jgi:peroxiredoxin
LPELASRGITVAAITADSPAVVQEQCARHGFTFPFLADPQAEVIRSFGLLHAHASPKKQDIARPAEFLIDSNGVVQWVNLTESALVRARPEQVLEIVDRLVQ